jgi:hypothetical protein
MSKARFKTNSELRRLIRLARQQRWTVERTRNNHCRFRSPNGKIVYIAMAQPTDRQRSIDNSRAQLRRAGLKT